jgi:two-component system phosphate regulon sensor histidine kinase PhoR
LSAVVGNLLENALLYAGKHPQITVTLKRNGKQIFLEVTDNGPGIPVEYLSQLFKPFFRVPSGNTHNVKGYGLGLSYCKQIVEQHGGTISASNLPTGGSLFWITLNT